MASGVVCAVRCYQVRLRRPVWNAREGRVDRSPDRDGRVCSLGVRSIEQKPSGVLSQSTLCLAFRSALGYSRLPSLSFPAPHGIPQPNGDMSGCQRLVSECLNLLQICHRCVTNLSQAVTDLSPHGHKFVTRCHRDVTSCHELSLVSQLRQFA